MKQFIISLMLSAAAVMIFESLVPDGGMKKYIKYLFSLFILIVLISPLKGIISQTWEMRNTQLPSYDVAASTKKANYIVGLHVKRAVSVKFDIPEEDITVSADGEKITLAMPRRIGLLAEDIIYYTANNFGVLAEVNFHE